MDQDGIWMGAFAYALMISREQLQEVLKPIVEKHGLRLFDLEYPTSHSPTLRVYVWKSSKQTEESGERRGVTLDECAAVSREISEWVEREEFGGPELLLEVSSPGINRRLRSPEHFAGAVGERVKLKVRSEANGAKRQSLVGRVLKVDSGDLVLQPSKPGGPEQKKGQKTRADSDDAQEPIVVPLREIEEARVDFVF